MKATLKNYRQAPRKTRLVVDRIRGKRVDQALTLLSFMPKRAAKQLKKLLESAVANAKQTGDAAEQDLTVRDIRVDEGITFVRYQPRARGRATKIRKRTSHITVSLGEEKTLDKEKQPNA